MGQLSWLLHLCLLSALTSSASGFTSYTNKCSSAKSKANLGNGRTSGKGLFDSQGYQDDFRTPLEESPDLAMPPKRVMTIDSFLGNGRGGRGNNGREVGMDEEGTMTTTSSSLYPTTSFLPNSMPDSFFTSPSHDGLKNNIRSWSLGAGKRGSEETMEGDRMIEVEESDAWETSLKMKQRPYLSRAITRMIAKEREKRPQKIAKVFKELEKAEDPLWFQVLFEAKEALKQEAESGPMIYSGILSQPDLFTAAVKHVSNVIAGPDMVNPIIQATTIQNLFETNMTEEDKKTIAMDAMGCAVRKPSNEGEVMRVILFNTGFHALVAHRLSHRLWQQGRKSLAHYIQSLVSSRLSCDIHPGAKIGGGIYLSAGAGVVIGETAVVGDDVAILQSVTLGGTGKNKGDRHPKIGQGVILQDSCAVLGNIVVGDGAVVTAKSIVLKEVPKYARVSGVPAKVKSYRVNKGPVADDFYGRDFSTNLKSGFDGWKAEWLEDDMRQVVLKAFEGYGGEGKDN